MRDLAHTRLCLQPCWKACWPDTAKCDTCPLQEPSSIEKVAEVDVHIGVAMSGLTADARTLIEHARVEAQVRPCLVCMAAIPSDSEAAVTHDTHVAAACTPELVGLLPMQCTAFSYLRCSVFYGFWSMNPHWQKHKSLSFFMLAVAPPCSCTDTVDLLKRRNGPLSVHEAVYCFLGSNIVSCTRIPLR